MIENSYSLLIIINAEMANFSYALHSHHRHQRHQHHHHHHYHHYHHHHCFNVWLTKAGKVQNIPLKCVKHFKNSENISATLKLSTRAMTLRSELTILLFYNDFVVILDRRQGLGKGENFVTSTKINNSLRLSSLNHVVNYTSSLVTR
uniref:Uncharacterized protein n=1 Tax=Glossina austeni TaxID=7395 RepID=A0A1A9VB71_GLOAU